MTGWLTQYRQNSSCIVQTGTSLDESSTPAAHAQAKKAIDLCQQDGYSSFSHCNRYAVFGSNIYYLTLFAELSPTSKKLQNPINAHLLKKLKQLNCVGGDKVYKKAGMVVLTHTDKMEKNDFIAAIRGLQDPRTNMCVFKKLHLTHVIIHEFDGD